MTHKLRELDLERSVDKGVVSAHLVLLKCRECLDGVIYVFHVYVVVIEVKAECLYVFKVLLDFVGCSLTYVADLSITFIYK